MTDTTVRCANCGYEQRVLFATCLRYGWPKHHGYTMTMTKTTADIGASTTNVLRAQTAEQLR